MKIHEMLKRVLSGDNKTSVTTVTSVTNTRKPAPVKASRGDTPGDGKCHHAVTTNLPLPIHAEGDCLPRPFITGTELIIPFRSSRKYHWWGGGQSVLETLRELDAPVSVMKHYLPVV